MRKMRWAGTRRFPCARALPNRGGSANSENSDGSGDGQLPEGVRTVGGTSGMSPEQMVAGVPAKNRIADSVNAVTDGRG